MSKLVHAFYPGLEGKVISRVVWTNQEDSRCLELHFADDTTAMFRVRLIIDEDLELLDGDGTRRLVAIPLRMSIPPLQS